jgi:hypothetical protein
MTASLQIENRTSYARWVLVFFAGMLLVRFCSGRYLSYIAGQPMKGPDADYSFWLVFLTGIPQFIMQHVWACKLTDGLVVLLVFTAFFFPGTRRMFIALMLIFFIEHITVEAYSCNHSKNSVALFMALLPLCFKEKHFGLVAEFVRYFIIFIMVSAAYHKLHNGALADMDHFQKIQIQQHLDLAILNPQHISFLISTWLTDHPFVAYMLFIGLFFMQAIFLLGIFTKNFDLLLCLLLFLFALSTYLLMRIFIWELLAGCFVFLLAFHPGKGVQSDT